MIFGLSEAASAVVHRLHRDGWAVVLAADAPPKVHRRKMALADVWWDGTAVLAGAVCVRITTEQFQGKYYPTGVIPFVAIGSEKALDLVSWAVAVDARLAKRGAPLRLRGRVPLSIGCGPGHVAGQTCDIAIETQWGPDLGAVIARGPTAALAGEPRAIDGVGRVRIVYARVAGPLTVLRDIGDQVTAGEIVARIADHPVAAPITGTLRGMLRDGIAVEASDKVCEVDPRPASLAVFSGIGQRPATIAEGVARAIETTPLHGSDIASSPPRGPHQSTPFTTGKETRP
ncbi:MAG: hypothetical protein ACK4S2_12590 [Gemmobacter sp.]|uniref:hypothetical protein n=1 Tax=Gemmobacter sp. TaxID=1898957 RepID=UPI00391CF937